METEVWGAAEKTFGRMHVEGGVADMGSGTCIGCGGILLEDDSEDVTEDRMGDWDVTELS